MYTKFFKIVFQICIALGVIVLIIWFNRFAVDNGSIQGWVTHFGYSGIFFVSILSGFNLLIPVPIIGFYPFFIESGFSALPLILTISVGMMLGDVLGYLIGNYGRSVAREKKYSIRMMVRLEALREKYTWAPFIFLFMFVSVIPLPNELVVIPMAFMGYKLRAMALALLLGNILFNTLSAWGFLNLLHLI